MDVLRLWNNKFLLVRTSLDGNTDDSFSWRYSHLLVCTVIDGKAGNGFFFWRYHHLFVCTWIDGYAGDGFGWRRYPYLFSAASYVNCLNFLPNGSTLLIEEMQDLHPARWGGSIFRLSDYGILKSALQKWWICRHGYLSCHDAWIELHLIGFDGV